MPNKPKPVDPFEAQEAADRKLRAAKKRDMADAPPAEEPAEE